MPCCSTRSPGCCCRRRRCCCCCRRCWCRCWAAPPVPPAAPPPPGCGGPAHGAPRARPVVSRCPRDAAGPGPVGGTSRGWLVSRRGGGCLLLVSRRGGGVPLAREQVPAPPMPPSPTRGQGRRHTDLPHPSCTGTSHPNTRSHQTPPGVLALLASSRQPVGQLRSSCSSRSSSSCTQRSRNPPRFVCGAKGRCQAPPVSCLLPLPLVLQVPPAVDLEPCRNDTRAQRLPTTFAGGNIACIMFLLRPGGRPLGAGRREEKGEPARLIAGLPVATGGGENIRTSQNRIQGVNINSLVPRFVQKNLGPGGPKTNDLQQENCAACVSWPPVAIL